MVYSDKPVNSIDSCVTHCTLSRMFLTKVSIIVCTWPHQTKVVPFFKCGSISDSTNFRPTAIMTIKLEALHDAISLFCVKGRFIISFVKLTHWLCAPLWSRNFAIIVWRKVTSIFLNRILVIGSKRYRCQWHKVNSLQIARASLMGQISCTFLI